MNQVAPIEIHTEDLSDTEEQLRFLLHVMEGVELSYLLPLMEGSFSDWIWRTLGIPVGYPILYKIKLPYSYN